MKVDPDVRNLVDLLGMRATTWPARNGYIFLRDGERAEEPLSYEHLHRRACSIARELVSRALVGERVLLLFPPGLDYIAALFGCFYSGAIAVPVYPPRRLRATPRLRAIIDDCRPLAVLADTERPVHHDLVKTEMAELQELTWLCVRNDNWPTAIEWTPRSPNPDDVALLQYTSGSTGRPKGVMVSQANLMYNFELIEERTGYTESDRSVIWLPPYHDMGLIGGILQPLYTGYSVTLLSPTAFVQRPVRWLEAITRYKATTSGGPNFAYDLCLRAVKETDCTMIDLSSWRIAFNGAEPVRAETLEAFADKFAPYGFRREAFYPCYGLAEATLMVTGSVPQVGPRLLHVDAAALADNLLRPSNAARSTTLVGCGTASADHNIRIIDTQTSRECKAGQVGEVWVRGKSVARGYWGRPMETAEIFNGFIADGGDGPFLRTGDLGVILAEELYLTGRIKDVIIVRGRNYYPHDIEDTAGRAHPALRPGAAVAFGVEAVPGEGVVIVQELDRDRAGTPVEEIAEAIRRVVWEEHEVMARTIVLAPRNTIPQTSSGKLQRLACKASYLAGSIRGVVSTVAASEYTVAGLGDLDGQGVQTDDCLVCSNADSRDDSASTARARMRAWVSRQVAQILGAPHGTADDRPLVALGLDSLSAARLIARINDRFGVCMHYAILLDGVTATGLADAILRESPVDSPASAIEVSDPPSSELTAMLPLAPVQQAIWLLHEIDPKSAAYNLAVRFAVRGPLNIVALQRALMALVSRHATLRTVFTVSGGLPRATVQKVCSVDLPLVDLASLDTPRQTAELQRIIRLDVARPLSLNTGPMLRATLLRIGPENHCLVVVTHHVSADGESANIAFKDLTRLYDSAVRGYPTDLWRLPTQYGSWAIARNQWLSSEEAATQLGWWQARLAGSTELTTPLANSDPSSAGQPNVSEHFAIPRATAMRLRHLAHEENATPFMGMVAAFAVALAKWCDSSDVIMGTPVSLRDPATTGDLIGCFINTVVLRIDAVLEGDFRGLLRRVRTAAIDAYKRAAIPFERVVQAVRPERQAVHNPLVKVMIAFHASAPRALVGGDAQLVMDVIDTQASAVDLALHVWEEADDSFRLALEYAGDRLRTEPIRQFGASVCSVIDIASAYPSRAVTTLPMVDADLRSQLVDVWGRSRVAPTPPRCVHELFEDQAAQKPDAVALVCGSEQLTYGELNWKADCLARSLRDCHAVILGTRVALYCDRSFELIIGMLGVLKAGGAYVPLDPSYSEVRLRFMCEDSGATVVLTTESLRNKLPGVARLPVVVIDTAQSAAKAGDHSRVSVDVTPDHLAYVIYTSGSTGEPKGTLVPHRSIPGYLDGYLDLPSDLRRETWLQYSALSWDALTLEVWTPLLRGARCVLYSDASDGRVTVETLAHSIEAHGVTTLWMTAALFNSAIDTSPAALAPLQVLVVGGEALSAEHVLRAQQQLPTTRLVNGYGPSECTVFSACNVLATGGALSAEKTIPLGRPVGDRQCYVLDIRGDLVSVGVAGELCIGGPGVADGYLHRPALTAERFVPDEFTEQAGARLYRSGDRVRWRSDGQLEFLGRLDDQVKIRGHRVELGEIEAVLLRQPGMKSAVAILQESNADKRIVAYVVRGRCSGTESDCDVADLREALRQQLPPYMVPTIIVDLDRMPLTSTGKVDRRLLPRPTSRQVPNREMEPGPVGVPLAVAQIWAELLGCGPVDLDANFFDLGGHSLLAAQIIARTRAAFSVDLPLRAVFDYSTVAGFAARVEDALAAKATTTAVSVASAQYIGRSPLSFAEERLWFLERLHPGGAAYVIPTAIRLRGKIDVGRLQASLEAVVARHDVLRSRYTATDGLPERNVSDAQASHLAITDLSRLPDALREPELQQLIGREAGRPFDLEHGPVIRANLVGVGALDHVLLLSIHHIACDGWSLGILVRELSEFYTGRLAHEAVADTQYSDYARRERLQHCTEDGRAQLNWWRDRLAGWQTGYAEIGPDKIRVQGHASTGSYANSIVPVAVASNIRRVAREVEATPFMVLLSIWKIVLRWRTGRDRVAVGTDVATRAEAETQHLIGLCVNQVVLATDLSGDPSIREVIARVRETTLEAFGHAAVPFNLVVDAINPRRDARRNPLFQVLVALDSTPLPVVQLPGISAQFLESRVCGAPFDLSLLLSERDAAFHCMWRFRTNVFCRETIDLLANQFGFVAAATAHSDMTLHTLDGELDASRARWQERVLADLRAARRGRLRRADEPLGAAN